MDQLLRNCQSQHLNLYVESYLKTVQKLLECPEPDMQVNTTISLKKGNQHPSTLHLNTTKNCLFQNKGAILGPVIFVFFLKSHNSYFFNEQKFISFKVNFFLGTRK